MSRFRGACVMAGVEQAKALTWNERECMEFLYKAGELSDFYEAFPRYFNLDKYVAMRRDLAGKT